MKFSVVTISFNQAKFLPYAIESILRQEGVDVEYIVVDPGSTDGSREIIANYREHFAHVIFEKDNGPADGLNRALSLATGDYFFYLNSDDEVRPGAFAEAARVFDTDPTLDVVYGNGVAIDENGKAIRRIYSAPVMTANLYARGLAVIVQQAAFIRTETLRRIGGFNVENRTCWDGEAFFDIAVSGGKFMRVWRNWGLFRIYGETISGSGRYEAQIKKDHARIANSILPHESPFWRRLYGIALWLVLRISDWRRWNSYFRGPFRPTQIKAK